MNSNKIYNKFCTCILNSIMNKFNKNLKCILYKDCCLDIFFWSDPK